MENEIVSIIVILLIVTFIYLVFFLLLREVVCWYLKINKNISLMKEHNALLNEVLKEIQKLNASEFKNATSKIFNGPTYNNDTKDFSNLGDLSKGEMNIVNQLYSGLGSNEVIIKHVVNGEIKKMSMKDYDGWIKYYDKDSMILLIKK